MHLCTYKRAEYGQTKKMKHIVTQESLEKVIDFHQLEADLIELLN